MFKTLDFSIGKHGMHALFCSLIAGVCGTAVGLSLVAFFIPLPVLGHRDEVIINTFLFVVVSVSFLG
jgi:hypothetical protein